jgi:hypothetical protein
MASKTLFITTDYLKKNSIIDDNVDDSILIPHITRAQDTHIHSVLGTGLYNALKATVAAGTVSGATQTLLDDYIQPALVEWTIYEALPFIWARVSNKSVNKSESEDSVAADLTDLKYMREAIRDIAEWYTNRMSLYLQEDAGANFPTYVDPGDGVDVITPRTNNFFGGMYLNA